MTTLVLGLDGGCFELIQPWIDDRTLPTFSKLIDDGVALYMQSCLPSVTCPNWQCYATGNNPGKLGVFWWEAVDRDTRTIENRSSAVDFDGTHYWRLLECDTAVVNFPTSYAPSKIDGIHIAGGPGAEQTGYTHPESLEKELREQHDRAVHPEKMSLLSGNDPDKEGSVDRSGKSDVIDWENSQVVASGQGPMYVSVDHPQKRERIAEELANDLEGITDPDGNPVFDQVLRGEDVYSGLYADRDPDIVLDQAAGVHIEGKISHDDTFGSPIKWNLFAAESEPMNREVIQVDATDLDDAGSPAVETDATDRLEDLGYME